MPPKRYVDTKSRCFAHEVIEITLGFPDVTGLYTLRVLFMRHPEFRTLVLELPIWVGLRDLWDEYWAPQRTTWLQRDKMFTANDGGVLLTVIDQQFACSFVVDSSRLRSAICANGKVWNL